MLTLVCFMAIAIALSRRLKFEYMGAITLLTAGFAQAFWALRPDLASAGQPFVSMLWSGGLYIASLILPFVLFKDFAVSRRIWMSWSIFELAQALFFVYAADKMWQREISGWIPAILACLKFPAVSALVSQLAGRAERNSILACHGGVTVLHFFDPFLLLETGWLAWCWFSNRWACSGSTIASNTTGCDVSLPLWPRSVSTCSFRGCRR